MRAFLLGGDLAGWTVHGFLRFPVEDDTLDASATESHGSQAYVKYVCPHWALQSTQKSIIVAIICNAGILRAFLRFCTETYYQYLVPDVFPGKRRCCFSCASIAVFMPLPSTVCVSAEDMSVSVSLWVSGLCLHLTTFRMFVSMQAEKTFWCSTCVSNNWSPDGLARNWGWESI